MEHKLVEKTIRKFEICVRCLIHPRQMKKESKLEYQTSLPPDGKNDVSVHRKDYTDDDHLRAHGEHIAAKANNPKIRFMGFFETTQQILDGLNQWANSPLSSYEDSNGVNHSIGLNCSIEYAPMIDDEHYYEADGDIYTDSQGIAQPMHANIVFSEIYYQGDNKCNTRFRKYAAEANKRGRFCSFDLFGNRSDWKQQKEFQNFNREPLLSIIVPFFKSGKFIERCAKSIFRNIADRNVEVIWINDGCPYDTFNKLEPISQEHADQSSIYYQTNQGQAIARNSGLQVARGKYVWFVDSDDEITDGSVDIILEEITRSEKNVYIFRTVEVDKDGNIVPSTRKYFQQTTTVEVTVADYLNKRLSYCPALMYVIKRDFLNSNNLWFKSFKQLDLDFIPRVLICLDTLVVVPKVIYKYWNNKNSHRRTIVDDFLEEMKIIKEHETLIKSIEDSEKKRALNYTQMQLVRHLYIDPSKSQFKIISPNLREIMSIIRQIVKNDGFRHNMWIEKLRNFFILYFPLSVYKKFFGQK